MSIKITIKDLRLSKDLTQRQLGDFIGITETNYRRLENNKAKSISLGTIETLCKVFECTPNDIFQIDND